MNNKKILTCSDCNMQIAEKAVKEPQQNKFYHLEHFKCKTCDRSLL